MTRLTPEEHRSGERCVELRHGWRDATGTLSTFCVLRPARVSDEVRALGDFRVFLRAESLPLILLSRVVIRLGSEERIDVGLIEGLAPEDLRLLEETYCDMNGYGPAEEPANPSHVQPSGGKRTE